MDTQNLQAFCAVAKLGSFSAAATQLFLTQPAISKRVAQLELQLERQLFDRIGRKIQLTEAGKILLPRATAILQELVDSRRAIAELDGAVGGELHLATSHHIGLHRLPPLLKLFAQQHPKVELHIQFLDSEKAYQAVQQGQFDLAVITLAPNSDPTIHGTTWWRDPLHFVVAADHPLALQANLSLRQLSRYNAILPDANTYTTALIKQLFDRTQVPLEINMATNYLDTIKMMVSIGLGWSVLPESLVDAQLHKLRLQDEHADLHLARNLGCIYHSNRTMSNAARAFMLLARSQIGFTDS